MESLPTVILRQAQDEEKNLKVLTFTLTLSLSKGERRPKAAKGEGGSSHLFNSLLAAVSAGLVA